MQRGIRDDLLDCRHANGVTTGDAKWNAVVDASILFTAMQNNDAAIVVVIGSDDDWRGKFILLLFNLFLFVCEALSKCCGDKRDL